MKKRFLLVFSLILTVASVLSACDATDVIANLSIKSFKELAEGLGEENYGYNEGRHVLLAPGGKEKFIWGGRLAVEIDLTEFMSAGLDTKALPEGFHAENRILTVELTNAKTTRNEDKFAAFERNVRDNRDALGFHGGMGHFGISLRDGFMFEWAQYKDKNDKDMAFLLNPAPFISAGLKTDGLTDWIYTELELMNRDGKMYKAFRLVRFYNF